MLHPCYCNDGEFPANTRLCEKKYIYIFMRSADWVLAMYVFDSVYMDNYMIKKLNLYDAKKQKKKT